MADRYAGVNEDDQARAELLQMIFGFRISRILHVAVELGLADILDEGDMTAEQLAHATNTHADSLHRLLRALVSLRVVVEVAPGLFRLSSLGLPLRTGAVDSVRALTLASCNDRLWQSWGQLSRSLHTGTTAFDHIMGVNNFEYLAQESELSAHYHEAMGRNTKDFVPQILAGIDLSRFRVLVDVGGGNGTLIAAILEKSPELRGILFDTAAALESATRVLDEAGVAERCHVIAGDFFEAVPMGGDAYLMKSIMIDWDDDSAMTILANCRLVMPEGSSLILIELIAPLRPNSSTAYIAISDLDLLVTTGGRERTEDEFRALLDRAGFNLVAITTLPGEDHLKALEFTPK